MSSPQIVPAAIVCLLLAVAAYAQQEVYTYVDEDGTIHFTDMPRSGALTIIIGTNGLPIAARRLTPEVPHSEIFNSVGARYRLDPALLAAVAKVESDFNPRAVSRVGAKGVMQLMDATAREYGVSNIFDPVQNIDAGARHLRDLLTAYRGDLRLSLAAYNAGRGAVLRHGGVPPYSETRRYLQKVSGLYGDLDSRISVGEIESSYAAARALARGDGIIYSYNTTAGASYSDVPPIGRTYEVITLRQ